MLRSQTRSYQQSWGENSGVIALYPVLGYAGPRNTVPKEILVYPSYILPLGFPH